MSRDSQNCDSCDFEIHRIGRVTLTPVSAYGASSNPVPSRERGGLVGESVSQIIERPWGDVGLTEFWLADTTLNGFKVVQIPPLDATSFMSSDSSLCCNSDNAT